MICKNCGESYSGGICPVCGASSNSNETETIPVKRKINFKGPLLGILILGGFILISIIFIKDSQKNDLLEYEYKKTETTVTEETTYAHNIYTFAEEEKKENPKPEISVADCWVTRNYSDEKVLVVQYEFQHNQADSDSFTYLFDDKAFQNGIECSSLTVCDDVDSKKLLNEVKPGVKYKVEVAYILQDTTTDVEIECYERFDFSDNKKPIYTHTITFN